MESLHDTEREAAKQVDWMRINKGLDPVNGFYTKKKKN
jgi:hypothetical protein